MYVTVQKTGKNKYVYIMESYSIGNGRTSTRIVKKYGRLDKLLEHDKNALEKLRHIYNEDRDAKNIAESLNLVAEFDMSIENSKNGISPIFPRPELNYGFYPIRKIWNDDFELFRNINYLQKIFTKKEYDVNRALLYLVAHKIIDPESILKTFRKRNEFVGDPAKDISLSQMYDAYSFADEYKDNIFRYINKKLDDKYGKERCTLVFYDVTNVYFESPMTDAEKDYVRPDYEINLKRKAEKERKEGRLDDSCFDSNGNLVMENIPESFWEEVKREGLKYFLMRGPSKEHRNDLPLVSVALVVDNNGFPMDFEIYAGNVSEFKSMRNSIASLKKKYDIGGAIVVADRGLNSLGNLQMLLESQLGFLVAQKVTQFDSALTEKMVDRNLYRDIDENDETAGSYLVIDNWKKRGCSSSNAREISCTLVLTYNEARKRRDEAILDSWVELIEKKAKDGATIGKARSGWASLAKTEKAAEQRILGVDRDALEKRRRTCGYAGMVFRQPPSQDGLSVPPLGGADIARLYHRLNNIEECFRIMKSELGLRPVHVRTYSHIRGHIAICVIALLIVRTIQDKLRSQSITISTVKICEALRDSKVFVSRSGEKDAIFQIASARAELPEPHDDPNTGEVVPPSTKQILEAYPPAAIMLACGLTPLVRTCSHRSLGRCLGTRFPTLDDAIPPSRRKQI